MNEHSINLIYDLPIEVDGILLYPVRLDKYVEFMLVVNCLLIDKNSIPDIKIISMNYLEYLIYMHQNGQKILLSMLGFLLGIVLQLQEPNITFGLDDNKRGYFSIDGVKYNGDTFEKMRNIICMQNSIDLPDERIQKEIRDKMEEGRRLKRKLSSSGKLASFEDQMICAMLVTGMTFDEVHKLTIRKFSKILARADAKLHYEINLSAVMGGNKQFKDTSFLKHWMIDLDDVDKNRDVTIGMDNLTNKISLEDKKIK